MTDTFIYIIRHSPHGSSKGGEGLDAALMGASFDLEVAVVFMHDGVFQLLRDNNSTDRDLKSANKMIPALPDFGIEKLYVDKVSMVARGVKVSDLMIEAEIIDAADIAAMINRQTRVFVF